MHAFDIALEGIEQRKTVANAMPNEEEVESKPATIAVVPFKNKSTDKEQEYFADSVHIL